MRVYELARELGLTAKEVMDLLAALKMSAKSHSSSLTVAAEERIRARVAATRPARGKKASAAKAEVDALPAAPPRPESKTPTGERILGVRKIVVAPPPPPVVEAAAPPAEAPVQEAPRVPEAAPPRVIPAPAAQPPAAAAAPPAAPAAPPPAAPPTPFKVVPQPSPEAVRIEPVRPPRREREPHREAPREAAPREAAPPAEPVLPPPERPPTPKVPLPGERRRVFPGEGRPAGRPQIQPRRPVRRLPRRRRVPLREPEPAVLDTTPQVAGEIELAGPLSVGELAARLQVPTGEIVKRLLDRGVLAGINQQVPLEMAASVAEALGTVVNRPQVASAAEVPVAGKGRMTVSAGEHAPSRPPVVTVMGHVDHGKTTLLDAIRKTSVADQEFGGITQHIGASVVQSGDRQVVFIDTPGHEAFTALRARGAQVTDVAVLVVAADDGVMPQTVEAVNHARAAGVPIIVVINKMDLPQASPERVKQGLAELGLVPEDWGGDTITVPVSARQGTGLDHLLEMILLVADMLNLRADVDRPARGTIVEARLDRGRGPVATVLVQEGRLRVGDAVVAGETYGRVRAMIDARGGRVDEATPSMPVEVLGLMDVPIAGDLLEAVRDERMARAVAEERRERRRAAEQATARPSGVESVSAGEGPRELRLIVKADAHGSIEALQAAVPRLSVPEVKLTVLHAGVGNVTESDVMLAAASRAVVVGFNVRPDAQVRRLAESEQVDLRLHRVIYEVLDDLAQLQRGMLAPKTQEVVLGQAEVRQVFSISRVGTIAGSYVTGGRMVRGAQVRLIRDGVVVYDGRIASLRRFKEDVREVAEGFECGIGLERFNDIKERDLVEAYEVQQVPAQLP